MRLTADTADLWLDDLAKRLNGGSIRLFDGQSGFGNVLVQIPLGAPAFEPSLNGRAITTDVPATPAIATGTVGSADFCSAGGNTLAILVVRERGAANDAEGELRYPSGRAPWHRAPPQDRPRARRPAGTTRPGDAAQH